MNRSTVVSPPWRLALLLLCLVICAVAAPKFAHAQQWQLEPIVRVGGEYDDNAELTNRSDEEVELTGLILDLRANIDYASARTSFSVQPRVVLRDYPDEREFDSDDFFLRSEFSHQGQLNTIGFNTAFDQQSVRTGERAISDVEIDDPDEITDDDTGRVFRAGTRDKWRVSPYWDYRLSDVSSLGVSLDYSNVEYDDAIAGAFVDYSDTRLDLNYRRKFTGINTGLLTVTARRYDPEDALGDVTGYGVMGGLEHAVSEKVRLRAMIGVENTRRSGSDSDVEAVGFVTLTRNLERTSMFVQYRRSVGASGGGRLSTRDSLNLNLRRRLSRKISAGVGIRAYRSSDIADSLTLDDDRNYIQLRSSFRWYVTRAFVIEAEYRYTVNDRSADIGGHSKSNQVNLWLVYQPKTIPKL